MAGTRHGLEVLKQFDKKVKTKNSDILRANSCVGKSCRGKTVRLNFFPTPCPTTPSFWKSVRQLRENNYNWYYSKFNSWLVTFLYKRLIRIRKNLMYIRNINILNFQILWVTSHMYNSSNCLKTLEVIFAKF